LKYTGLSRSTLKYSAMVFMLLDHILYFFKFTEAVPIWFGWLGRLAAPIFLFMLLEGFRYTRNLRRYISLLYLGSLVMGLCNYAVVSFGLVRPDGIRPINNIFSTFFIVLLLCRSIELSLGGNLSKGIFLGALPFIFGAVFIFLPPGAVRSLLEIFIPSPFSCEGGLVWVLFGLIFYLLRDSRKTALCCFAAAVLFVYLYPEILSGAPVASLFNLSYGWMAAFACILLNFYNGKPGHSPKFLFYAFYPLHVYILYFLSFLSFNA